MGTLLLHSTWELQLSSRTFNIWICTSGHLLWWGEQVGGGGFFPSHSNMTSRGRFSSCLLLLIKCFHDAVCDIPLYGYVWKTTSREPLQVDAQDRDDKRKQTSRSWTSTTSQRGPKKTPQKPTKWNSTGQRVTSNQAVTAVSQHGPLRSSEPFRTQRVALRGSLKPVIIVVIAFFSFWQVLQVGTRCSAHLLTIQNTLMWSRQPADQRWCGPGAEGLLTAPTPARRQHLVKELLDGAPPALPRWSTFPLSRFLSRPLIYVTLSDSQSPLHKVSFFLPTFCILYMHASKIKTTTTTTTGKKRIYQWSCSNWCMMRLWALIGQNKSIYWRVVNQPRRWICS